MSQVTHIEHLEIPTLTPLRGIAAVAVFYFHLASFHLPAIEAWLQTRGLWNGVIQFSMAVDFFFMLSGYLLFLLYAEQFRRLRAGSIVRFWKLRFCRIYPLLFVTSTGLFLLLGLRHHWESWKWISDLLLVNAIPRYFQPLNAPAWTISAEWFAYLSAPFLFFALMRLGRIGAFAVIGVSGATIIWFVLFRWNGMGGHSIVRGIAGFAIGSAVARLLSPTRIGAYANAVFLAGVTAFLLMTFLLPRSPAADLGAYATLIAVISVSAGLTGRLRDVLNARPLEWLGLISFSVYLWHTPLFEVFEMLLGAHLLPAVGKLGIELIYLLGMTAAVLVVSHLSHCVIEIKGSRVLQRIVNVVLPAAS